MQPETSNMSEITGVFIAFVKAKAVHDFHYGSAYDSYPEGSKESAIYQSKLAELANKKDKYND